MRLFSKWLLVVIVGLAPVFAFAENEVVPPATYLHPSKLKLSLLESASPPVATTTRSERSSWYFGIGIGGGLLSYAENGVPRNTSLDSGQMGLHLRVGKTLSQSLLLGYETSFIYSYPKSDCYNTTLLLSNHDLVLTWFPWKRGAFVHGGGGLTIALHRDDVMGVSPRVDLGGNVLVGAGYTFPIGGNWHLSANADYSMQFYGGDVGKPTQSQFVSLWLGLDWM